VRLLLSARRTGTALLAAVVLAVLSPGTAHASQVEAYDNDFPDPFVLPVTKDGTTTYYAYATNREDRNVQVMSSADPTSFTTAPGDALPTLGSWAEEGWTWAPAVLPVAGRYVLYYTAHVKGYNWMQCIGRAVSDVPTGPFVDGYSKPLVCQTRLGGSIDPDAFRDKDGALYLHWKSDDNAIGGVSKLWGSRLTSDGLNLSGKSTQLLKYDQLWEDPLIEAPQMVRAGSGLHLFYSGNWWESATAAVGYGVCSSPLGRCTKKTKSGPWLAQDDSRVGPAGETFFQKPDGSWWVAYHAWDDAVGYGLGGVRSLFVNSVSFSSGSPVLTQ
jgi:hypothetical protein